MIPDGLSEEELERFCVQTVCGGLTDEQATLYIEYKRGGDVKITVKQKRDGKWSPALLPSDTDGTVAGVLLAFEGQEVVIEVDTGKGKGYLVGSDALLAQYTDKGKTAYRVTPGVERLTVKNPKLMAELVHPLGIGEIFPGITLAEIVDKFDEQNAGKK